MEDNYLISILGTQELDGETDTVEVITSGRYIIKNGKKYIKYTEYDSENPQLHFSNVIKIDEQNTVTVIRGGDTPSRLTLEKGKRHQCHYNTLMGSLMIGVFTDTVKSDLDANGGNLRVCYTLDFNSGLASKNEFNINVKQKGV